MATREVEASLGNTEGCWNAALIKKVFSMILNLDFIVKFPKYIIDLKPGILK